MIHLYCLTHELHNEMLELSKSTAFPEKVIHGPVLELPDGVQFVDEMDYMYKTIKHVFLQNDPFTGIEFVSRRFASYKDDELYASSYLDTKINLEGEYGHWRYVYATVRSSCVYVSQYKYSGTYKDGKYVTVNVQPDCTDEYYSVQDIVASSSKELLNLAIPPDPDMFSAGRVRYIIPISLL